MTQRGHFSNRGGGAGREHFRRDGTHFLLAGRSPGAPRLQLSLVAPPAWQAPQGAGGRAPDTHVEGWPCSPGGQKDDRHVPGAGVMVPGACLGERAAYPDGAPVPPQGGYQAWLLKDEAAEREEDEDAGGDRLQDCRAHKQGLSQPGTQGL